MWAGISAYAESMRDVIGLTGLKCWEKNQAWEDATREGCFRVMHEEFCIVSDFPREISRNSLNQPHCETGPSHRWSDGFEIYHLNGVRVPKWLVKTPAEKIDPQKALKETNADVQREIIRKIGAERMLQATGAVTVDDAVDPRTGLKYSLKRMSVGDNINRLYLYFEHASMPGVFYAKCVPPECKKALHARAWILSMIERQDLTDITHDKEAELISNFPSRVS